MLLTHMYLKAKEKKKEKAKLFAKWTLNKKCVYRVCCMCELLATHHYTYYSCMRPYSNSNRYLQSTAPNFIAIFFYTHFYRVYAQLQSFGCKNRNKKQKKRGKNILVNGVSASACEIKWIHNSWDNWKL